MVAGASNTVFGWASGRYSTCWEAGEPQFVKEQVKCVLLTTGLQIYEFSSWEHAKVYLWEEILLKKVRRRKCDPLGPVDRQDFHDYI